MTQRNKELEEVLSGEHYGAETKKVQSRLNSPEMEDTIGEIQSNNTIFL